MKARGRGRGRAYVVHAGLVIPGFTDLHLIGAGGASDVYRARETAMGGRIVAVKVLKATLVDKASLARFEEECALLGRLSGVPNVIVPFQRGVVDDGTPWLSMEYFSEGSLATMLEASGPMSLDDVVEHLNGLAGALTAAHGRGILHRDVKPENAFATNGLTKLADFGISVRGGRSSAGDALNYLSPLHAAPEALEGRPPTFASDIYSLASTTFQLLNGYPPFPAEDDEPWQDLCLRVMRDDPAAMIRHDLAAGAQAVLLDALAKDPADRPLAPTDLALRFAEALDQPSRPRKAGEGPSVAAAPPAPSVSAPVTMPRAPRRATSIESAPTARPIATTSTTSTTPDVVSWDRETNPYAPGGGHQRPTIDTGDVGSVAAPSDPIIEPSPASPSFQRPGPRSFSPPGPYPPSPAEPGLRPPGGPSVPGGQAQTMARDRVLRAAPSAPDPVDRVRSPLVSGAIVGGVICAVVLAVIVALSFLVDDAPSSKGTIDAVPSSVPKGAKPVSGDPALRPGDISLSDLGDGYYLLEFADATEGRLKHDVFPARGDAPTVELAKGETSAELVGTPYACVLVGAVEEAGTLSMADEVCA